MPFLKNCWYVAAWSSELGESPLGKKIIGERVVLYRTADGDAVAIGARCPHRFAPLDKGKVVGDLIECPYHGLRFNRDGVCVLNQFEPDDVPPRASVKGYAVVERQRLIFIWMGDQATADIALLPNFPELIDTEQFEIGRDNILSQMLPYELILDNLMDLSHTQFVHANSLGNAGFNNGVTTATTTDRTVKVDLTLAAGKAPVFLIAATVFGPEDRTDTWSDATWTAPAFYYLEAGGTLAGEPREKGEVLKSLHLLTPEDENTTVYRYIVYRSFARGNEVASAQLEGLLRHAFVNEDEPMLRDVRDLMNGQDFWALRPVILPTDKGAVLMRRTLQKLIKKEAAALVELEARD